MRIGLSMWSLEKEAFAGKLSAMEFIGFAGTLGIDGVEVLDCFWRDEEREVPLVKAAAADTGLLIACYSIANDFVAAGEAERREQFEYVKRGVDTAARLGARVVRVFSGNAKDGIPFATARGWIVDGLAQGAAYAAEHGVTLALENHGLFAGRSAQVAEILKAVGSPALAATTDTANFLLVGEESHVAVAALADRAAHVHLKDFRKVGPGYDGLAFTALNGERYTGTVIGEGDVNLPAVLGHLAAARYDGFLAIEYEGTGDPREDVRRSLANLKALL